MRSNRDRAVLCVHGMMLSFFLGLSSSLLSDPQLIANKPTVYFGDTNQQKASKPPSSDSLRFWKDPAQENWEKNPNLAYFREIANSPTRSKDLEKGFTVFFDLSCPLEYLNTEYDYYWDQKIYYLFQIKCVAGTPLGFLAIPSNSKGFLTVGKKYLINLTPGERFFAKMKFGGMRGDRVLWEDVNLYHE